METKKPKTGIFDVKLDSKLKANSIIKQQNVIKAPFPHLFVK